MHARGFYLLDFLVVLVVLVFLAIVLHVIDSGDESVMLDTAKWECVASAEREYTYYSLVGRISVQHVGRRMECTSWVLRK